MIPDGWLWMGRTPGALAAADPARRALRDGGFPWYDSSRDDARSVLRRRWWEFDTPWEWPEWSGWSGWSWGGGGGSSWSLDFDVGELIVIGLVLLAISVLTVILLESWRRRRSTAVDLDDEVLREAGRIEGLPEELRPATTDPWSEAQRLADRGEYTAAIVRLFAVQLLTLDRAHLIALGPGKTARQLVRSVEDADLRNLAWQTLRLFEAGAYGHRRLDRPAFASSLERTEAIRRFVAQGGQR